MLQRFGKSSGPKIGCDCQQHQDGGGGHKGSVSPGSEGGASSRGLDEGLECPVCWESFDDGENTPYVLWCGHSLCKNCVLSLQWAVIKLPGLPLQLPLFISCPWCQFLTFRFTWKGLLKYPCKNFFLLWVVESMRGDANRPSPNFTSEETEPQHVVFPPSRLVSPRAMRPVHGFDHRGTPGLATPRQSARLPDVTRWDLTHWRRSGIRLAASFLQFTAKLPLVLLFLFIVVYVLPFSTLVLALYCLVTVLFAVPSFLVVYFSYPSLDWLVRAIVT
jgi:hypothetical protein